MTRITLNVGGTKYETTLETISSIPNTMFDKMFNGKIKPKPCEDGSYFIDNDGEIFKYILHYLRFRTLKIGVPSDSLFSRINKALDYYGFSYQVNLRDEYPMISVPNNEIGSIHFKLCFNENNYLLTANCINSYGDVKLCSAIYFKYRCRIRGFRKEKNDPLTYKITVEIDFDNLTDVEGIPHGETINKINNIFANYWNE